MYKSNLVSGNNYTSSLEEATKALIEHEKLMKNCKKVFPNKIFTFYYDAFVNNPRDCLTPLLEWLNLDWNEYYLHPEKTIRTIKTASFMQARNPINNKSVDGWMNYKSLLTPAIKILDSDFPSWR